MGMVGVQDKTTSILSFVFLNKCPQSYLVFIVLKKKNDYQKIYNFVMTSATRFFILSVVCLCKTLTKRPSGWLYIYNVL